MLTLRLIPGAIHPVLARSRSLSSLSLLSPPIPNPLSLNGLVHRKAPQQIAASAADVPFAVL